MSERVLFPRLRQAVWLGLVGSCFAAACVPDVSVPPCVYADTCGDGGESMGSSSAGEAGQAQQLAGSGGDGGSAGDGGEFGGAAGTGGAQAPGGSGGAQAPGGGGEGADPGGTGGAPESEPCERCNLQPAALVPPCLNRRYQTTLTASGGEPPYQWQLTPQPDRWSISVDPADTTRGVLTSEGARAEDESVTITLKDAKGRKLTHTFELEPRTTCWFAFTAQGAEGGKLHIVDPLTENPEPADLGDKNVGVADFAFSPNGRFLAYRFGEGPKKRLALVELSTLTVRQQSFSADHISRFAWSPDSSLLAVAYEVEVKKEAEVEVKTTTYLGALRLPPPGSSDSPVELEPTPAFVESELAWVGNRFVTYHAAVLPDFSNPGEYFEGPQNPELLRTVFYAELDEAGFTEPQFLDDSYETDNLFLQTTGDGVYAISTPDTTFSLLTEAPFSSVHSFISLVSPSGAYTGRLDDSILAFLSAEGGSLSLPAATAKAGETCPHLLAWSRGSERVACVADTPTDGEETRGEVRFFTLEPGSNTLNMTVLAGGPSSYGTQAAQGAARVFSPSGRLFAFTRETETSTFLYWAATEGQVPQLAGFKGVDHVSVVDRGTRLAFSPDERLLSLQRGSKLFVQSTTDPAELMPVVEEAPVVAPCSESLLGGPSAHCGNADQTTEIRWAADSKALARRASSKLMVTSLSATFQRRHFELTAPGCSVDCSGQFEFQPAPKN